MKMKLILFALTGWGALAVMGVSHYSGSGFVYLVFSLVFLAILASGFYRNSSYGYMFLAVMLWLGFWLKFTLHLVIGYDYIEPLGYFTFSAVNLDSVLKTCSVAGAGVLLAWALQSGGFRGVERNAPVVGCAAPYWYCKFRGWLWGILWLGIIVWPLLNVVFGTNQIGLVPQTVLAWPMTAVISWFVTIGVSIAVMTLLWWDVAVKADLTQVFLAVLVEATFSTVSLISRGTFVLHAVPPIIAAFKGYKTFIRGISRTKLMAAGFSFLIAFLFAMSMVTTLRTYLYSGDSRANRLIDFMHVGPEPKMFVTFLNGGENFLSQILVLGVDRWIGIEGVMSVQSYPSKGKELLFKALHEKREIGKVTMYQEVCNSHYRWMDSSKWQFAAIPGAAAFFYYSGSRLVVLLGLFVLTMGVILTEAALYSFLGNPFLCSLWGLTAANTVSQFGISPLQLFPYFFMVFCALFCIWLVQMHGKDRAECCDIPRPADYNL